MVFSSVMNFYPHNQAHKIFYTPSVLLALSLEEERLSCDGCDREKMHVIALV